MAMKTVIKFRAEGVIEVDPADRQSILDGFNAVDNIKASIETSMSRVKIATKLSTVRGEKASEHAQDVKPGGEEE